MDDLLQNIVSSEVETFFMNMEGSLSISIINLGEYPIQYYTSPSSVDDLRSTDLVTHFAHELTKLIHSKTNDSKYIVSVTTHFFQYLNNHYGDSEEMLKTVVENLVRNDLVIILSRGSNQTMEKFTSTLRSVDPSIIRNGKCRLASLFTFSSNEKNRQPLLLNQDHVKNNTEFDLVNTLLSAGFAIPSEGFLSFLYIADRYALDATTRIMNGTEFYDDEKQAIFKKIIRFLLSVFALVKTISLSK